MSVVCPGVFVCAVFSGLVSIQAGCKLGLLEDLSSRSSSNSSARLELADENALIPRSTFDNFSLFHITQPKAPTLYLFISWSLGGQRLQNTRPRNNRTQQQVDSQTPRPPRPPNHQKRPSHVGSPSFGPRRYPILVGAASLTLALSTLLLPPLCYLVNPLATCPGTE
ncbi:hypothetical protein F4825DRAFT_153973 [Nemania diffusa]|nr:hypothetical protein F4825DRAFT_153973 [Nemania diffusa]